MAGETKHTPLPWRAVKDDRILGNDYVLVGKFQEHNGETEIGVICGGKPNDKGLANAQHIIRCVNSYDAMAEALHLFEEAMAKRELAQEISEWGAEQAAEEMLERARDLARPALSPTA